MGYALRCFGCDSVFDPSETWTCSRCGEPLAIQSKSTDTAVLDRSPLTMWQYRPFLPIQDTRNIVSIGEGATPLVTAARLAGQFGFGRLWFKNEMTNPTGSFKDRQISVGISHAIELGMKTVAVVSSGNVACAASAYAAHAGLRAVLLMHAHAASAKATVASAHGGRVIRVDTPSAGEVFALCIEACRQSGWYHLSTAGMYNPFNVEGAKTIAYELYRQTDGSLPDWVVAPVGGGGLLGGIWRGFLDLKRLGLIDRVPRLVGVQATGCAPLKKAIDGGTRYLDILKDPWPNPKTIAGGIADDILFDGHTALPAIRTTQGIVVAVDDREIVEAQRVLATQEGLLCEPTSAVVIAALSHLPEGAQGASVCCVVTGSGAKDLAALEARVVPPVTIEPTLSALQAAVADSR